MSGNFQIRPMMTAKDRIARLFKKRDRRLLCLLIFWYLKFIYKVGLLVCDGK
ncbi:unnamed protein product [Acidithrix sp. C25]|nr:unnamed protein product [Acidithrix sp. C25]